MVTVITELLGLVRQAWAVDTVLPRPTIFRNHPLIVELSHSESRLSVMSEVFDSALPSGRSRLLSYTRAPWAVEGAITDGLLVLLYREPNSSSWTKNFKRVLNRAQA
jgi:hypothetical protein